MVGRMSRELHHDERTLALRKLEDLLPGKGTRPAIATNTCLQVTTWAGLPMSTNWKDTSQNSGGIAYVYQLERHKSRLEWDCLCLLIGKTRVKTRAGFPMSTN